MRINCPRIQNSTWMCISSGGLHPWIIWTYKAHRPLRGGADGTRRLATVVFCFANSCEQDSSKIIAQSCYYFKIQMFYKRVAGPSGFEPAKQDQESCSWTITRAHRYNSSIHFSKFSTLLLKVFWDFYSMKPQNRDCPFMDNIQYC